MRSNLLVRLFGFKATLVHGDTLVMDRWRWLVDIFEKEKTGARILDVGCGTGAFSIGLSRMGFKTTGLTWDKHDTSIAIERARLSGAGDCTFEIQDARKLDERSDFSHSFDFVLCTENIEHILNDQKLMKDMANCLKPEGKLILTTPNIDFIAITKDDDDPPQTIERGGHVRRGYSKEDLERLCTHANLQVVDIGFISGFFSQKVTRIWRILNQIHPALSFVLTFQLRILPLLFDRYISYPGFSITLIAKK